MDFFFSDVIESVDRDMLLFINGHNTPWLDSVMWSITHTYAWSPLFLLLIALMFHFYGRRAWRAVLIVFLAVACSDIISSGILKPLLHRLRPTHDPDIIGQLRIFPKPNGGYYYGGSYGFPSSHAANSTMLAITSFLLLKPFLRKQWPLALLLTLYVITVCYTRPYFGVHYPTDILVGCLLAIAISFPVSAWMRRCFFPEMFCDTIGAMNRVAINAQKSYS